MISRESKHIIQRQIFQVHLDKQEQHHELTEEIKRIFNTQIVPQLSKEFDEISQGRTIRIDKLEIELPKMNLENWKEKFSTLLVQEIKREIELQLPEIIAEENEKQQTIGRSTSESAINRETNIIEAFLFFCQKGYFPWWFQSKTFASFEKEILNTKIHILENSVNRIVSKSSHLERLVKQFSDGFFVAYFKKQQKGETAILERKFWENILLQTKSIKLHEIRIKEIVLKSILFSRFISNIGGNEKKTIDKIFIEKIIQFIQIETKQNKTDIALEFFKIIAKDKKPETENTIKVLKEFIQKESDKINFENDFMLPDHKAKIEDAFITPFSELEKEKTVEDGNELDLSKDIHYIKNAGIVIVWPFLTRFFESLNLAKGTSFNNEESKIKAILILQYLADGKTHWNEHELFINKIICGYPLSKTIPTDLELTEEIKEQSELLFGSIIEYWDKLKNTSAAGVQSGFIQREGKLEMSDNHWKLTVKRETLDILLDHIPWSFRSVKLPWMKKMIRVDW